jgi:spore maturation protein SpmA
MKHSRLYLLARAYIVIFFAAICIGALAALVIQTIQHPDTLLVIGLVLLFCLWVGVIRWKEHYDLRHMDLED